MREIKFKAWHNGRKQMFWFDVRRGNHGRGDGYIGMVDWGKEYHSEHQHRGSVILVDPEDCELMQYTGLKDKNGKEIYEGDLMQVSEGSPIHRVEYIVNDACWYLWRESSQSYFLLSGSRNIMEIIGNIYENPELVNQKVEIYDTGVMGRE